MYNVGTIALSVMCGVCLWLSVMRAVTSVTTDPTSDTFSTVSYTHLDVYKRQVDGYTNVLHTCNCSTIQDTLSFITPTAIFATTHTLLFHNFELIKL